MHLSLHTLKINFSVEFHTLCSVYTKHKILCSAPCMFNLMLNTATLNNAACMFNVRLSECFDYVSVCKRKVLTQ